MSNSKCAQNKLYTLHICDQYNFYRYHHQRFGEKYCLHLHGKGTLEIKAAGSSKMLVIT